MKYQMTTIRPFSTKNPFTKEFDSDEEALEYALAAPVEIEKMHNMSERPAKLLIYRGKKVTMSTGGTECLLDF